MNIPADSRGFTLIELVVVIIILGILGAAAIPTVGNMIETSKINSTKDELLKIKEAIVGEHGYIAEVGSEPTALDDLVTLPTGVSAYNKFTRVGWNGPYISDDGTGSWKQDAWENDYIFSAGQIKSYGPDGADGGGDDITMLY